MQNSFRTFLIFFCLPVVVVFLLALPNLMFYVNSGERAEGGVIANYLVEGDRCLYGRASLLASAEPDFKFHKYSLIKPKIIAMGSSRSMQFVQDYFSVPFFTFGGVNHNVEDVVHNTEKALALHKPEFIIFQLDYWWFNQNYTHGSLQKRRSIYAVFSSHLRQVFEPYFWLRDGKITQHDFKDILHRSYKDKIPCRLGINALKNDEGYEFDGSYFYGQNYIAANESIGFENSFEEIDFGRFHNGGEPSLISIERLERFEALVRKLELAGIGYAIVLPPLAPDIYERILTKQPLTAEFIELIGRYLKERFLNFGDFTNPSTLKTSNCEFIDDVHAGQIAYSRILTRLEIPYLNKSATADINNFGGRTVTPNRIARYMTQESSEADFLNLGCLK